MSTLTAPSDGGTLGAFDLPDWRRLLRRRGPSTSLNVATVTPEVADVIAAWEGGDLSDAPHWPYPKTEVEAVRFIQELLRVPAIAVLTAVGISEKTFYNWAGSVDRPRRSSSGVLWPMTQTLYRLHRGHADLVGWYHSSDEVQHLFANGDANGLALAEATWAVRNYPVQRRPVPDFDHGDAGSYEPAPTRARRASGQVPPPVRRKNSGDDVR